MIHNFQPLVSIVIPVYNGSNYLRQAIDSALAQTYENFEILVINDGSTDNGVTEQIARSYGNRIRYFHKENGGVGSALNLGIREMRGEYFSWLSHDDFYYPYKLQKQIEYLEKQKDRSLILISDFDYFSQENKEYVSHKDNRFTQENMGHSVFSILEGRVGGCSMLIHKSHFQRVGVFNETLKNTQDYDLWFRMFRHQKILYLPEPLMAIRLHSLQGTVTNNFYSHEEQELWSSFLNYLTDDEILSMYPSKYYFYLHYAVRMRYAKIEKAYQKAVRLLKNELPPKEIKAFVYGNISNKPVTKICLFGAGKIGKRICSLLQLLNITPDYFCDNDAAKIGNTYNGIKCKDISQLVKDKDNILVIMSIKNTQELRLQLDRMKIPNLVDYKDIEDQIMEYLR